jgi:hypothetical protein
LDGKKDALRRTGQNNLRAELQRFSNWSEPHELHKMC